MERKKFSQVRSATSTIFLLCALSVSLIVGILWDAGMYEGNVTRLRVALARRNSLVDIQEDLPSAEEGVCLIFSCTNRVAPYMQVFSHEGFKFAMLDVSSSVEEVGMDASWCRVPQLQNLRGAGHKCVIFVEEDVYLNLTQTKALVDATPKDHVLVGTERGKKRTINSGLLIFTDIHGRETWPVLAEWRNRMYMGQFQSGVMHQEALNDAISCETKHVDCFDSKERELLGLKAHCETRDGKVDITKRVRCMQESKAAVREWDAKPTSIS